MMFLLAWGCIEEYDTGSIYEHEGDIAVSGWITDEPGLQEIKLSLSVPLQKQVPTVVEDCFVQVEDDLGNTYTYQEFSPGRYFHRFNEGDISAGRSYQLTFVTPEGKRYASDFEEMLLSPEAGEIYYEFENMETEVPGEVVPGLQFYTRFNADGEFSEFYKIEVLETYEFHTAFQEIFWLHDGAFGSLPDDSLRPVCYLTEKVSDIFLFSGTYLDVNQIDRYPLHFVSNRTQKLLNGYSPELRILALTGEAHNYWKNQQKILQESGGLFESQPPTIQGNIYCLDDPDEQVLGYFGASTVTGNRIYIPSGILDQYSIQRYCEPTPIDGLYYQRLVRIGTGTTFFIYFIDPNGVFRLHIVTKKCFDCTAFPYSTTMKPEYWEE
jgi:hypothetical protein